MIFTKLVISASSLTSKEKTEYYVLVESFFIFSSEPSYTSIWYMGLQIPRNDLQLRLVPRTPNNWWKTNQTYAKFKQKIPNYSWVVDVYLQHLGVLHQVKILYYMDIRFNFQLSFSISRKKRRRRKAI